MRLIGLLAILTALAAVGGCAGIGAALCNLFLTCCLSCQNGGGPVPPDDRQPDDTRTLAVPASSAAAAMTS
jgi:hypothetical protein